MPGLALSVIEQHQPLYQTDVTQWSNWEKLRYEIYIAGSNWQELVNRYEFLPANTPLAFRLWAAGEVARAWNRLKRGGHARAVLRRLMWTRTGEVVEHLPEWRRIIVESYLADNLVNDALTSSLRFRMDYGEAQPDASMLYIRSLLIAGRYEDATALLGSIKNTVPESWYLLAKLRANSMSPGEVMDAAVKLSKKKGAGNIQRYEALVVATEAAHRAEYYVKEIIFLEKAIIMKEQVDLMDGLFAVTADDLWDAYHRYAEILGNEAKLLVGDDARWKDYGDKLKKTKKEKARAIFAFLANKGGTPETRDTAHEQLVNTVNKMKHRHELLKQLYMKSSWYSSVADVPVSVRHVLAEEALKHSDMALASEMLAGLEPNGDEKNELYWNIRRSRVHIMAGHYPEGVSLLHKVLSTGELTKKKDVDRLVQVLFDLQGVGQHQQAFELFGKVLSHIKDEQHKREILFWMADSKKEIGKHEEAARLYLRSAILVSLDAMDPWATSARYHAAKSLADAGLRADARAIYLKLMKHTKDLGRRKVLQREIRQLWMKH